MPKTDVYSWRLDPNTKAALEDAARERESTVAAVLDEIVGEWLLRHDDGDEAERQQRLHEAANRFVGAIASGDLQRAESSRERIRERLRRRHADA